MRWARAFVLVTAGLIGLYGVVVAAVGMPARRVEATSPGAPAPDPNLVLSGPTPQALLFVAAAVLLAVAVLRRRPRMAWSAWGGLALLAIYTGFTIGLPVLPLTIVLTVGLAPLSIGWRRAAAARG